MTENQEPVNPIKSLKKELAELIEIVQKESVLNTTNYLLDYIQTRIDLLKSEKESTEYDYCEHLGRIKELELIVKTLKELN